jgi:hypothetical protein
MIRTGIYRYVVWAEVDRYLAAGWIPGGPVSGYSAIMWACECNAEGVAP